MLYDENELESLETCSYNSNDDNDSLNDNDELSDDDDNDNIEV